MGHRCGNRDTSPLADQAITGEDTWRELEKHDGDRTCSFCGSLHPDDFLAYLTQAKSKSSGVSPSRSTLITTWYMDVTSLDGKKATRKFYTWHLPDEEYTNALNAAIRVVGTEK